MLALLYTLAMAAPFAIAAIRGAQDDANLALVRARLDSIGTVRAPVKGVTGWILVDTSEFDREIQHAKAVVARVDALLVEVQS